jgi:hypothetical protein
VVGILFIIDIVDTCGRGAFMTQDLIDALDALDAAYDNEQSKTYQDDIKKAEEAVARARAAEPKQNNNPTPDSIPDPWKDSMKLFSSKPVVGFYAIPYEEYNSQNMKKELKEYFGTDKVVFTSYVSAGAVYGYAESDKELTGKVKLKYCILQPQGTKMSNQSGKTMKALKNKTSDMLRKLAGTIQSTPGFYGTDIETYYVNSDGEAFCIQSPDFEGERKVKDIPENAKELSMQVIDEDLQEAASRCD